MQFAALARAWSVRPVGFFEETFLKYLEPMTCKVSFDVIFIYQTINLDTSTGFSKKSITQ